jgi:hypothetical protein
MLHRRGVPLEGTALTLAAMHGQVGACAALLRDEHVRQAICRGDDSAIAQAIAYGRADVLDTLLSVEGVSLDPASWLGAPQPGIFMQLAAKNNSIDIIKLLLDHGLPVDATCDPPDANSVPFTALAIATKHNFYDLAKLLLERGASVCSEAAGASAFRSCMNAVTRDYVLDPTARVEMLRLLVKARPDECTFDERDGCRDAVILATVQPGSDLLRFLLDEANASPNQTDGSTGATALHYVIVDDQLPLDRKLSVLGLLIDHDAELHTARTTDSSEHGFPAGVTPYEALDYAPSPQRAKLQEFVDARVALREPRREA